MEVWCVILPIQPQKLVTMATLNDRKKWVRFMMYYHFLPFGENLMKVSPVDPETLGLNRDCKR